MPREAIVAAEAQIKVTGTREAGSARNRTRGLLEEMVGMLLADSVLLHTGGHVHSMQGIQCTLLGTSELSLHSVSHHNFVISYSCETLSDVH